MTDGPLRGFTVAVTAARRHEELVDLLARRGARVVLAPAIRIIALPDDTELLEATRALVQDPPQVVVATTGVGFRGWMQAADGWGLGEGLRAGLSSAYLVARGPKARGAVRAAGLSEAHTPESESMAEVLAHLLAHGISGARVAIQLHGGPQPEVTAALVAAGASVVEVPVYRWAGPVDRAPLRRLVELTASRQVDAVTFTSAPAVEEFLREAGQAGVQEAVEGALSTELVAACVGPVCAGPLRRRGIPSVLPERARLGALVRLVADEVPARRSCRVPLGTGPGGRRLEIRGHAAAVDGTWVSLPPAPMSVLRALARSPGRVLSRADLLDALPGGAADEHAVEMAVTRLRAALGAATVQTVIKRGYRLPVTA